MELPKRYDPKVSEEKWQKFWEEKKIFAFYPDDESRKIFSIDTPPPTVSGKMHLGHAFGNSQQDFIARYKRMKGFNVLQPFGTDDNGLPTKLLIEKLKKVRAKDMSRDEFRKLCLDTLNNELKPSYTNDWKRLGISCDFNVNYSTIDPHCQKISQKSFLDLYAKGKEYRSEAPAMFCPKCQTAISQVECEDEERDSFFNDIVFKVDGEDLIIATTRPELLCSCVAVIYHPEDSRYNKLGGKKAEVPLFDFKVPLLADKRVDPEKGTGIVMCCTFGDQTDMEWQKAFNLPIKEGIGRNGRMTAIAKDYEGMKPEEAKKKIIADLEEKGLLVNQKKITHAVNVHERCGTAVEFIHSKQWFIKYLELKEDMMKWGEEFDWHPKFMKNRYDNWVGGLQWDWCISRQLPFGIPFPVWYCKDCDKVVLAKEEDLPVDPTVDKCPVEACECGCNEFVPETDIINTWATSSLTPTIVKELFVGKKVYNKLVKYPMSLRPQGHDIISFWLFNTVVKSNLHYDIKPWDNCFINGWMLDSKGKKMSKSKGNVIEPQVMIDKYSADALRYMAAGCSLGEDLPFPEKDVVTGKKTVTKLWNASKFVIMNLDGKPEEVNKISLLDKWILIKLDKIIENATKGFESFEFSKAKFAVDNFFWNTFAANYIEIVKDRFFNPENYTEDEIKSGKYTLYKVLLAINKMYAPFIPFITEEIYQMFFKEYEDCESIHICKWPSVLGKEGEEEKIGDAFVNVLSEIRKYKSEKNMSLKKEIEKITVKSKIDLSALEKDLKACCKVKEISFEEGEEVKVII